MTHINLLPWREQLRKERERQFYSIAAGAVVLMVMIIFYIHLHINGMISSQNARNTFLEEEIKSLDIKIKEIRELESEKEKLMARMNIIEQLQSQRPLTVHLFQEIVHTLPEGVYLTEIKQDKNAITLQGVAQSNARISAFMRNLDESEWLGQPRLEIIKGKDEKSGRHSSEFILHVTQKGIAGETGTEAKDKGSKDGKTGKGAKGKKSP